MLVTIYSYKTNISDEGASALKCFNARVVPIAAPDKSFHHVFVIV